MILLGLPCGPTTFLLIEDGRRPGRIKEARYQRRALDGVQKESGGESTYRSRWL